MWRPSRRQLRGLAALTTLALAAAGCGRGADDPAARASPSASATTPAAGCQAEEHPPLQAGSHLIGDADPPVPYSSVPPTSGWHASGALRTGVHDEALSDPEIVALLEVGQVVAVYDPATLADDEVAALEELATTAHDGRLHVTPGNTALPAPLTLTAWGVLQRCDAVSAEAIANFVLAHHGQTEAEH